jgi:hypothetical protein
MPCSKAQTIYKWKKRGLIYDNYDELYEVYIKTMECQHCKTEFTKKNKRCLDHSHESGLFRKIVCHRCNAMDSYINYPFGYTEQDRKEYHQEYRRANKQKKLEQNKEYYQANKEYSKQKIECECGSVVRRREISRHNRSKKHSDYKLNNLV